jgi:hypothetical protein
MTMLDPKRGIDSRTPVSFDEFQLFYESTEKVTDRRLELNRTNASLMMLVIAGIGATAAWAQEKPENVIMFALGLVIVVCFLSMLFCRWWWKQVEAYKDLNGAKFEVLNEMAAHVVFSGHDPKSVKSARPFEREWEILSKKQSLQKYKKGLALGSSLSELTLPKSFLAFFAIGALLSATLLVIQIAS